MKPITADDVRQALPTNPAPAVIHKSPSIVDALAPIPDFPEVKGYNPYSINGEITGYESFATKFADSMSPQETNAIKLQIDAQKQVFGVDSYSEFKLLMSTYVVAILIVVLASTYLFKKFSR
ncbi:TPA: hypothetical protein ACG4MZ_000122 [Klebsiella aerogenes]